MKWNKIKFFFSLFSIAGYRDGDKWIRKIGVAWESQAHSICNDGPPIEYSCPVRCFKIWLVKFGINVMVPCGKVHDFYPTKIKDAL